MKPPTRITVGGGFSSLLLLLSSLFSARADTVADIHVHAAYVINFIRYTVWPDALESASSPYILTVVGSGESAHSVIELARRAGPVGDRDIRVIALDTLAVSPPRDATTQLIEPLEKSHAVFVTRQYEAWGRHVIDASAGKPVLTIGTGEEFALRGGMLSLVAEDSRVVFVANADAIERAGIVISAKVHQLARPLTAGSAH